MNIQKISIAEIKANPKNPRVIRDDKFQKLVQSIQDFPEMLNIRPLVLDENNIVLGGNMRLRALQELGFKEVPVLFAKNLSEKQKEEFIVKDNVSYGDWDWTALKELDTSELDSWGLDTDFLNNVVTNGGELEKEVNSGPRATDDDYSTFELIMLHENKLELIDTLQKIKKEFGFEKLEEALMEMVRVYNK